MYFYGEIVGDKSCDQITEDFWQKLLCQNNINGFSDFIISRGEHAPDPLGFGALKYLTSQKMLSWFLKSPLKVWQSESWRSKSYSFQKMRWTLSWIGAFASQAPSSLLLLLWKNGKKILTTFPKVVDEKHYWYVYQRSLILPCSWHQLSCVKVAYHKLTKGPLVVYGRGWVWREPLFFVSKIFYPTWFWGFSQ